METSRSMDVSTFRAKLHAFSGGSFDAYPTHTERLFPHVFAKMLELWDKPEMEAYLQSLMAANRRDFPAAVAAEIFCLSFVHGSPQLTSEQH